MENLPNSLTSKKTSIMSNVISQFKSQFIPEKVDDLRITTDGNICVPVGDKYIAITKDNKLFSYPESLTFAFPVYTIKKSKKDIKVGDIVRGKNSYGKVTAITKDGSVKILTYKGTESTKKDVTDALTQLTLIDVVVNMFDGMSGAQGQGFNPMMALLMDDQQDFNIKDLMMMQMMQGSKGLMGENINPLMLMMLDKKEGSSSDSLTELLLMSQLSQNGTGFNLGSLFGVKATPETQSDVKPEEVK